MYSRLLPVLLIALIYNSRNLICTLDDIASLPDNESTTVEI